MRDRVDPDDDVEQPDLGPCCACPAVGPAVRNVLMLSQKAPMAGRGWACLLCNLPADGAIAVVCDACLETTAPLTQACRGYPGEDGRVPIGDLEGSQQHDQAIHAVDAWHAARAPFEATGDRFEDEQSDCREDDKAECSALSGGTAHSPCRHCGAETGCVPVLMFRGHRSGARDGDVEMWAVCDDCLVKEYRLR